MQIIALYSLTKPRSTVSGCGYGCAYFTQFANVSATHLTSGAGSLEVQLINMRQDVIMGFFRNGTYIQVHYRS